MQSKRCDNVIWMIGQLQSHSDRYRMQLPTIQGPFEMFLFPTMFLIVELMKHKVLNMY